MSQQAVASQALDEEHLREYLSRKLPEIAHLAVTDFRRYTAGMSYETYGLTVTGERDGQALRHDWILRMEPASGTVPPYDVARQFSVLAALAGTPVPVPPVHFLEADPSALGRPFFVMSKVEGEVPLPVLTGGNTAYDDPAQRSLMAEDFLRVLTALHTLDWRALPLDCLPAPADDRDFARRELARWASVLRKHEVLPQPILWEAHRRLAASLPAAAHTALVHGDFRVGNFIWDGDRIVAYLDWEDAALGDPLCDVGWVLNKIFGAPRSKLVAGLFEREQFLRRYEELTGRSIEAECLRWWEAMSYFKFAVQNVAGAKAIANGFRRDATLILSVEFRLGSVIYELARLLGV